MLKLKSGSVSKTTHELNQQWIIGWYWMDKHHVLQLGFLELKLRYFEKNGEPLFSSHMLDLSEESLEDNISICKKYLERMAKINLLLEMELGVTGGEEDAWLICKWSTDSCFNSFWSVPKYGWFLHDENMNHVAMCYFYLILEYFGIFWKYLIMAHHLGCDECQTCVF